MNRTRWAISRAKPISCVTTASVMPSRARSRIACSTSPLSGSSALVDHDPDLGDLLVDVDVDVDDRVMLASPVVGFVGLHHAAEVTDIAGHLATGPRAPWQDGRPVGLDQVDHAAAGTTCAPAIRT